MAEPWEAGVVDSDILIDAIRGRPEAVQVLGSLHAGPGVQTSVISAMELIDGCRNATELEHLQAFLLHMEVLPATPAISQTARHLMESFALSHRIGIPDALIAATAQELGLHLYSRNLKHFKMIPGLAVIRPY
ncbi:MAG: ribonuclease VapC [Phycisphaerae bacterium]